jgi:signal transduction histidine kinase
MGERVASPGGDIVVHGAPGRGMRVCIRVGLQPTLGKRRAA